MPVGMAQTTPRPKLDKLTVTGVLLGISSAIVEIVTLALILVIKAIGAGDESGDAAGFSVGVSGLLVVPAAAAGLAMGIVGLIKETGENERIRKTCILVVVASAFALLLFLGNVVIADAMWGDGGNDCCDSM